MTVVFDVSELKGRQKKLTEGSQTRQPSWWGNPRGNGWGRRDQVPLVLFDNCLKIFVTSNYRYILKTAFSCQYLFVVVCVLNVEPQVEYWEVFVSHQKYHYQWKFHIGSCTHDRGWSTGTWWIRRCNILKLWLESSYFWLNIYKHCQRHNGPEDWVFQLSCQSKKSWGHITSSNTNLEHISSSESWLSIN